jgi:hypothetical protein
MIKDHRDYEVSLMALADLRSALKRLGTDPKVRTQEISNLRLGVKDLEKEIREYEHHATAIVQSQIDGYLYASQALDKKD